MMASTTMAWKQTVLSGNKQTTTEILKQQQFSDSEGSLSEEEDQKGGELKDQDQIIFGQYLSSSEANNESMNPEFEDLSKVRTLLAASRNGAISCLICLEKVRSIDPIWDCKLGCHSIFHLVCIQEWARQASNSAAERSAARFSRDQFPLAAQAALENAHWHCPKCRSEYPKSEIPRGYKCFCGKLSDPPNDPWLTPHSCGEICGNSLKDECGHNCVLLCHPGPCPPCPKLVRAKCFCGAKSDVRRCGMKEFSCNRACSRSLGCGLHKCLKICHAGECPPCEVPGIIRCVCNKVEKEGPCSESGFHCENPCGKELGCKKHRCSKGCHSGSCGECELQGRRTCPCVKVEYKGVSCDASVPTCGSTCEKLLSCSRHRCPERCHQGSCVETCRILITKSCRCGGLRKQVPCYQDLLCEKKCQRVRDCGRHACKRRCCDRECPPCSEMCGRKLRCNNHKCPAPCHRGSCAPCPITVRISCACGETAYEVPCGTEKGLKPPKCSRRCLITPLCRHGSKCKPHRCHYGPCPPCGLICEEDLSCGHKCKERCHGPKPPPNPDFALKPKKRKNIQGNNESSGVPCPPCKEFVERQCVGNHIGGARLMVCSQIIPFRCGSYCGNLLHCGNHFCEKPCHKIALSAVENGHARDSIMPEFCDECSLPCMKKRLPECPHPCPKGCHPAECPVCSVLIKRSCHCGAMVHVFECNKFNRLSEEQQQKVRSCGGPCHRKLPNCTHLCPEICHPSSCPSPEMCRKKVTVRCSCQRLKKEWQCLDVQAEYLKTDRSINDIPKGMFGLGILPCDKECARLLEDKMAQAALSELRQRNQIHTEDIMEHGSTKPKRRKRHAQLQQRGQYSRFRVRELFNKVWKCLRIILLVLLIIAIAFFGYKGLFWLSDWMNDLDEQRARTRRINQL